MGQESTYTDELAAEICERIATGEPLRAICRDEHMPSWTTVYNWIKAHPEFAERIAHARELGFDAIAEQCIDIADDERHDWVMSKKGVITDEVAIARAKLRVHTRMQLLSKWSPKKYGEKIEIEGKLDIGVAERLARARGRTG